MSIQGANSGPDEARKAFDQRQYSLIDNNRATVRAGRDIVSPTVSQQVAEAANAAAERAQQDAGSSGSSRRDAIELSAAAQASAEPSTAEREARVQELTEAHRSARLNTADRIERAAQRLLGN